MNEHVAGESKVISYIVSFLLPSPGEEEARRIIEECGATLNRWMAAISMAVICVSVEEHDEVMFKLESHPRTNYIYVNATRKRPQPLS